MDQQIDQRIDARELREAAQFVEETTLDALADYSDIAFPLAEGDLKTFPRPSPQDQAARQGFAVLRASAEQAVAALYALAAAREAAEAAGREEELPAALLAPVWGHVAAYRAAREASGAGRRERPAPRRRRQRR
jgi:hypothetical protein